ncbi:MAG: hypothetical protein J0H31_00395, partial [Alphaproteobacteria bacterium]|nr:hypothetical protein [Alphaproteobacteria bacterium]
SGLHAVEDWGRWADGKHASLLFDLSAPAAPGDVLEIKARAFVPKTRPNQIVHVSLDGKAGIEWKFTRASSVQTLSIPLKAGMKQAKLEFDVPGALSPKEAGESIDSRELGLGLTAICFANTRDRCLVD